MTADLGGRLRLTLLASVAVVISATLALWGSATTAAAVPAQQRDVPDVAMVIAGGTGQTRTLRSGETAFAGLWQLLEPMYVGTQRVPEDWVEGRHPPIRITVIWGLTGVGGWPQTHRAPGGDVAVQRQDQLFVAEDGTPWVRSDLAPDVVDDDIRWHRAPRAVFERLDQAGLLGDAEDQLTEGAGNRAAGGAWSGSVPGDAGWALAGLAVGVAAGVGGTLWIRRAAARPEAGPPREEPRQELIDLDR
ncbi:hypothetical protein [Streptomyces lanatus]|uniref:Uncharacterized protein n=1 Tax=Streptomyces lanatus TaxID=66900 RepID=A0ABV1XV61_9ACTN|nr:hypothetical protein [Streptomyces lanatus]GHH13003.1 hypothetical protein GCM10018780_52150 [Streptomyces lanatus]